MRIRVEYFDQNESFAAQLPRNGYVEKTPKCSDSPHVWHLLRLDDPLEYEGVEYSHFLLASRWQGYAVGEIEPVSVFILLVPSAGPSIEDGFSLRQFRHAAWGMAQVVSV